MAVLSWLKSKQRFTRKSVIDEFREFAKAEKKRMRSSGSEFDKDIFEQATKLVLHKLEPSNKDYRS